MSSQLPGESNSSGLDTLLRAFFCSSSQGKGVGSARKKLDASILEDRDKPYACDSECLTSGWVVLALDPAPQEMRGGEVVSLFKVVKQAWTLVLPAAWFPLRSLRGLASATRWVSPACSGGDCPPRGGGTREGHTQQAGLASSRWHPGLLAPVKSGPQESHTDFFNVCALSPFSLSCPLLSLHPGSTITAGVSLSFAPLSCCCRTCLKCIKAFFS